MILAKKIYRKHFRFYAPLEKVGTTWFCVSSSNAGSWGPGVPPSAPGGRTEGGGVWLQSRGARVGMLVHLGRLGGRWDEVSVPADSGVDPDP